MFFSVHHLIFLFVALVVLSTFFSLAEAAMLSVNRYRLRHLMRQNHRTAKLVYRLLEHPDRLLSVILLCDTFADILASAIATLLAIHFWGEESIFLVTLAVTFVVLILGEIAPKTLAALYPEKISFIAVWPLFILSRILYPAVAVVNSIANSALRLVGVEVKQRTIDQLSHEELHTLLHEAGGRIPVDYQSILLKTLDLGKVTVEDIMVPRNEIIGINLNDDWETILQQLTESQHTRLPLYHETLDNISGFLHVRKILNLLAGEKLNKDTLQHAVEDAYFVLEGTSLNVQLLNFRREKRRIAFVVNEYGDLQGLVTLEDILEELVGEFTTDLTAMTSRLVHPQADGSYLVDGTINLRDLNRLLKSQFPLDGPKTLSGLIIEYLEMIPSANTCLRLNNYPMEILQVKANKVKNVRIFPVNNSVTKEE